MKMMTAERERLVEEDDYWMEKKDDEELKMIFIGRRVKLM